MWGSFSFWLVNGLDTGGVSRTPLSPLLSAICMVGWLVSVSISCLCMRAHSGERFRLRSPLGRNRVWERPIRLFLPLFLLKKFIWLCQVLVVACRLLSSTGTWAPECAGSVVLTLGLSCPRAHRILVPWPGIKPCIARWILNHWIPRDIPFCTFSLIFFCNLVFWYLCKNKTMCDIMLMFAHNIL